MTVNNSCRVLVFFGADVKENGNEILQEASKKGYTLLALDTFAIGKAIEANVPFSLIDDWIDSASIIEARNNSTQCEQKWFESSRDMFTLDEICWPDFDHYTMKWFWADVMLATVLINTFQTRGVREVRFIRRNLEQAAIYYSVSDICKVLWGAQFPDFAKPYEVSKEAPLISKLYVLNNFMHNSWQRVNVVVKALRKKFDAETKSIPPHSAFRGKIILAFNPGEYYRFSPIIQKLCESLPGKIAAVILSSDFVTADRIADECSIPVICAPSSVSVDPEIVQRFLDGYENTKDTASGQMWENPIKHLQFHFEQYCTQRWPIMEANFRSWSEFWKEVCPKAVIVSSLQDTESQIPAKAARCLDVPCFSIPHGVIQDSQFDTIHVNSGSYFLCGIQIQKILYGRNGIPPHLLIACRDALIENEYPVTPVKIDATNRSCRLLSLMGPIGFEGCLAPTICPRAQLEALDALNYPPIDIAKHLSLHIKVHPGSSYSNLELFDAIGDGIKEKVLPTNSDLSSVLEQTDLVVSVNYIGSALVHAINAGKPVIYFWTDPLTRIHMEEVEAFSPECSSASNPVEFWSIVRNYIFDIEFKKQMDSKAQKLQYEYLSCRDYPQISEVLEKIIVDC